MTWTASESKSTVAWSRSVELRDTHKEGVFDSAQLHARWAEKLARSLGIPLASVAPPMRTQVQAAQTAARCGRV